MVFPYWWKMACQVLIAVSLTCQLLLDIHKNYNKKVAPPEKFAGLIGTVIGQAIKVLTHWVAGSLTLLLP
jgi:hypothetical protein